MSNIFAGCELHPQLIKALEFQGFTEPTEVQKQVFPEALKGSDIQISAETGSGKTIAYLAPLINRLMQPASADTGSRALILLPTRELAQQIFKECNQLADFTKTKSVLVTGGQEMRYQAALLRRDPDIIVATPGRLIEHLSRKNANLRDIEVLILDEADRMLDMGFFDDVSAIIDQCNKKRQTMLLSATLNHRGVSTAARAILDNAVVINIAGAQTPHENIEQKIILSDDAGHKRKQLLWLLRNLNYGKAVVFANKRIQVGELHSFLRKSDIRCNELHGEIPQDERKHIMSQFKQGNFNVLVATDVAARGLDIKGLELVINFDMAHSGDEYVHRIGRTGRAGEKGTAISLVADYEWN
ncbi:MAG: DEAD/DEAH box helicase, partial [Pseudomonadales bacterium]